VSAPHAGAGPLFHQAPLRVYWELTRACDLACRHCRAEAQAARDPEELDTAEALGVLDRLAAFGAPPPHLVLTGGDPFKRPDLWALVARARGLGLPVSVAPSATPLLDREVVARLKAAGVEAISLSLDAAVAGRHDALRGVPGCFTRTLEAMAAARAEGLPVQVNTLVCRETLPDLPAVHALVRTLGAPRWSLFFLVTVGRGSVLEPITPEEAEALLGWLADRAAEAPPLPTTTEAPHFRRVLIQRARARGGRAPGSGGAAAAGHAAGIRDGNGIMFIGATGLVYPSGFLPVPAGHVRRDDPVALYRQAPLFRALRRPDLLGGRCGRCEYRGICGGSRARAWAATGDPLAEDPLCLWEPAALRSAEAS
jgi:radical SAM protein